jgi:hypothetical protein
LKTIVTVSVRIQRVNRAGRVVHTWERAVSAEDGFPDHLAEMELKQIAHAQLHPPKPEPAATRD